jgi:hypothetical protein
LWSVFLDRLLPFSLYSTHPKASSYQYQFNEWDKGNNDAIEWLKKDPKHQTIGLPHSELEKARQLEKPHYDEWLSVARKGFDGEKLLDKVRSLARKYAD